MTDHDPSSVNKSLSGKGVFPSKWAFTLLLPLRGLILSASALIRRLALQHNMHVLEVGPGPGYFSLPFARALKNGQLVLADIQPEMLDYARRRIERAKQQASNQEFACVEYHLCNGSTFPFPDHSFDRIVLVTVLGEVENQSAYLLEFHRLLKPDGLLSISELAGDPDQLSVDTILTLATEAGFALDGRFGGKRNYTVNLHKAKSVDT